MKHLLILIVVLFTSACCGTKKAIETQPEPTNEIEIVTEKPNTIETPRPTNNNGNIIAEVNSLDEAGDLLEIKHDSINKDLSKNQNITKHTGYVHDLLDELLQKYVLPNGKVNYKSFKNSHKELLGYIKVLSALYPKLDKLSKEEKLAYWINAYNALTIDLIIRNFPLKSIKDIKDPWDQRLWKFGNKWYNLNDIEHKILRKMNEPRIHFTIVCASESCPQLQNKAFTASNLEEQLANATKAFLSDSSKNEISQNHLKLSKIFKWFKKDFEQNGSLIDFLNQYTEVNISSDAKKSFKNYNWDLND